MTLAPTFEDDDGSSFHDSGSDEDDSDEEYDLTSSGRKRKRTTKPKKYKRRKYELFELPFVAVVTSMATDLEASASASKLETVDSSVLARIQKALRLTSHAGTGENESKQAMRMATKLMSEQNLTQADLIANESAEERKQRAGQSVVSIRSKEYGTPDQYGNDLGKKVKNMAWHGTPVQAVCEAFNVKVYSTTQEHHLILKCTFYGLADNTVAAALSFEMRKRELKGDVAAENYKNGVAERVYKEAKSERRAEEKKAEEEEVRRLKAAEGEETKRREAEIKRLSSSERRKDTKLNHIRQAVDRLGSSKVKVKEVEDEDEIKVLLEHGIDVQERKIKPEPEDLDLDDLTAVNKNFADGFVDPVAADFDDDEGDDRGVDIDALEDKIKVKQERGSVALRSLSTEVIAKQELEEVKTETEDFQPTWTSALQLRTFRQNASHIAKEYLKSKNIKLHRSERREETKFDAEAFNLGWEDGKKVDLKRRKIEGAEAATTQVSLGLLES